MVAKIEQTLIGAVPSKFRKAWTPIAKAEWRNTAAEWHRDMLPLHFTHEGARLYGFGKRKGENHRGSNNRRFRQSYTGRKEAKMGHTLPNVYSGLSRRLARQFVATSTTKGVAVKLQMTARNYKHRHGSNVNQFREYSAVAKSEQNTLTRSHDRRINSKLRNFRDTTKRKAR